MSIIQLKKQRIKKLDALRKQNIEPYPSKSLRTNLVKEALDNFEEFLKTKKDLVLSGRIRALRPHGGSTFLNFEDGSGKIQAYLKQDELGEKKYQLLSDFDIGDFIEIKGALFLTQKGEKTILAKDFRMLAKSLRPLPETWFGLKDKEERFRKRYLDLIMNPETRQRFLLRAKIITSIREFLDKNYFIEVETPILQPLPGGALAKPFQTHLNALNMDLYLRIAPELYLKRLLVGGFEKVYEIGRCFRNEGMDFSHNPDFTMLEFYWAYADYNDLMDLTEKMFKFLMPSLEIEYQNKKIDLKLPWKRIALKELILERFKIDIEKASPKEIMSKLKEIGVKPEGNNECRAIDGLFKIKRQEISDPTFVIDYPVAMSPLAKSKKENSEITERFQLIIGGLEIVNAYSELNEPLEQTKRMKDQVKKHNQDIRYDDDFIEALEYGMPPAAGFGMGIDRLVMLLTNSPSLREVILFPVMRPKS